MSNELKPCPFCGHRADIFGDDNDGYCVQCRAPENRDGNCFAAMGENYDRSAMPEHMYPTAEDAAAAWNRRAEGVTTVERVSNSEQVEALNATIRGLQLHADDCHKRIEELETAAVPDPSEPDASDEDLDKLIAAFATATETWAIVPVGGERFERVCDTKDRAEQALRDYVAGLREQQGPTRERITVARFDGEIVASATFDKPLTEDQVTAAIREMIAGESQSAVRGSTGVSDE